MSRELLNRYFEQVEQQLLALPNLFVEQFVTTILTTERANLKLRIRFKGKYLLSVSEALVVLNHRVTQIDYRYHFQNEQAELIFRYDSTPHFPDLPTFPHHKHLPTTVIATSQPEIAQVFQEASSLAEQDS